MLEGIILCGGLGTRIRNRFSDLPKALVPVNGRPFIEYIITDLIRQGVTRVHLAAGYRAGQLRDWVSGVDFSGISITVTVSVEPAPLGTAGGIKHALPFFHQGGPLLVLNGDSLLPHARIADLDQAFRTGNPRGVIAAVTMTQRGQYGTLEVDPGGLITAFREKAENNGGLVNGGIYLLDPTILDTIPEGTAASIEHDVFPTLAAAGHLAAVCVEGPLLDMGTPEGLERTEAFLAAAS